MLTSQQVRSANRLYVALDVDNLDDALRLVDQLGDTIRAYKVGMQLFYKAGAAGIQRLRQEGVDIFLDLKFHDIPKTVAGAADSVTSLEVSMINVHAAGGFTMMQQAKQAATKRAALLGIQMPLVIAVTQLTSTDQQTMNQQLGIPGTVEETVVRYAQLAKQAGLDGVVASGLEVPAIKSACGDDFITVVPGIRPAWAASDDQKRILTPAEAISLGADRLVIGRPITHANDPKQAASKVVFEIEEALSQS